MRNTHADPNAICLHEIMVAKINKPSRYTLVSESQQGSSDETVARSPVLCVTLTQAHSPEMSILNSFNYRGFHRYVITGHNCSAF